MNKPEKLAFSDEATFSLTRGIVLIPLVTITSGFILVLLTTDATPAELVVPCVGTSGIGFIWGGILGIVALGHRLAETRAINRMFDGEILECWQLSSSEWQALVEAECNLISPREEGLKAYEGAVYSSIFGIILAIILIAVGMFAIDDPQVKSIMWILAVVVFLLLLGIGLFQPVVARYNADRYRRKCLRVAEPRVWFASEGVYHEALGHTSLKELEKVTDQIRSRKAITFTITVSTESSDYSVSLPFPVPSGCEERAGILVRRYRQERLSK
ncbi:MAG: hypothetical protein JXA25_17635 [Anaerolineales bacterium]|nr:hypothetical protein [Anaerolineales bacterium]